MTTPSPRAELDNMTDHGLAILWRTLCDWPSKTAAHEALLLSQIDAVSDELAARGYISVMDYPR